MRLQKAVNTVAQMTRSGAKIGIKACFFTEAVVACRIYQDAYPYDAWEVSLILAIIMLLIPIGGVVGFTLGIGTALLNECVERFNLEPNELTFLPR